MRSPLHEPSRNSRPVSEALLVLFLRILARAMPSPRISCPPICLTSSSSSCLAIRLSRYSRKPPDTGVLSCFSCSLLSCVSCRIDFGWPLPKPLQPQLGSWSPPWPQPRVWIGILRHTCFCADAYVATNACSDCRVYERQTDPRPPHYLFPPLRSEATEQHR